MSCLVGRAFGLLPDCNQEHVLGHDTELWILFKDRFTQSKVGHLYNEGSMVCKSHFDLMTMPKQTNRKRKCKGDHSSVSTQKGELYVDMDLYFLHIRQNVKFSKLKIGSLICRNCKMQLEKVDESDSETEKDPNFTLAGIDISSFNNFLTINGIPEIVKGKQNRNMLGSEMSKKIRDVCLLGLRIAGQTGLTIPLPFDNNADTSLKKDSIDLSCLIQRIRTGIEKSESQREKLILSTLIPKSWPLSRASKETGLTPYTVKKGRILANTSGILAEPPKKKSRTLSDDVISKVRNFFYEDDISRCLPGMNTVVKVNGQLLQTRLLLHNLNDAFRLFQDMGRASVNPNDYKLGISSFCSLRPKEIKLAKMNGMHNVCVCDIHDNIRYSLQPLHQDKGFYKTIISKLVCDPSIASCMLGFCENCGKRQKEVAFRTDMMSFIETNDIKFPVNFPVWASTDRAKIAELTFSKNDYLDKLVEDFYRLIPHHFTTKSQGNFYYEIKLTLPVGEGILHMDYAMSYLLKVQNSTQGDFFLNKQLMLFPYMFYFKLDENTLITISGCVISDHDSHAAETTIAFLHTILRSLLSSYPIKKIHYFSDGTCAQFKNCKMFAFLVRHKGLFAVDANWNFFATAHGKGAVDGVGAVLKKMLRDESMRRVDGNFIQNVHQAYEYLLSKNCKTQVHLVTSEQVKKFTKEWDEKYIGISIKTAKGCRSAHRVEPVGLDSVLLSRTSDNSLGSFTSKFIFGSDTHSPLEVSSLNDLDRQDYQEGEFVAVVYGSQWYFAKIISFDSNDNTYNVTYLDPAGSLTKTILQFSFKSNDWSDVLSEFILDRVTLSEIATSGRLAGKFKTAPSEIDRVSDLYKTWLSNRPKDL